MSDWTHRLVICAPFAGIEGARAIARALDPDVGGALNFDALRASPTAEEPASHAVCDCLVKGYFAAAMQAMQASPEALFGYCAQDYVARWPGLTPPTLADCQALLSGSVIVIEPIGRPLAMVLADAGLYLIPPAVIAL